MTAGKQAFLEQQRWPTLQVGDCLCLSSTSSSAHYWCTLTRVEEDGCWLSAPREGSMFVPIALGSTFQLSLTQHEKVFRSQVSVIDRGQDRLARELKLSLPHAWTGAAYRSAKRIQCLVSATLLKINHPQLKTNLYSTLGTIEDIRLNGAKISTRITLKAGDKVLVQFQLPPLNTNVAFIGQIVRVMNENSSV